MQIYWRGRGPKNQGKNTVLRVLGGAGSLVPVQQLHWLTLSAELSALGNNRASCSNPALSGRQEICISRAQFKLRGTQVQAQVLAVALNVYATTSSLGGSAGAAYGFAVNSTGLGAQSYSVGKDGTAFGVPNNTTLNVYQLLLAVNKQAAKGVLYGGNATLQSQAADLFNSLNQAGSIP
jgi:hypothetical protein